MSPCIFLISSPNTSLTILCCSRSVLFLNKPDTTFFLVSILTEIKIHLNFEHCPTPSCRNLIEFSTGLITRNVDDYRIFCLKFINEKGFNLRFFRNFNLLTKSSYQREARREPTQRIPQHSIQQLAELMFFVVSDE